MERETKKELLRSHYVLGRWGEDAFSSEHVHSERRLGAIFSMQGIVQTCRDQRCRQRALLGILFTFLLRHDANLPLDGPDIIALILILDHLGNGLETFWRDGR